MQYFPDLTLHWLPLGDYSSNGKRLVSGFLVFIFQRIQPVDKGHICNKGSVAILVTFLCAAFRKYAKQIYAKETCKKGFGDHLAYKC